MKSRFILPNSVVTKLSGSNFDFFGNNISFSSQLTGLEKSNPSADWNSIEIFAVDDSFTIFSLTYDINALVKGAYKVFLYPNSRLLKADVFDNVLNLGFAPYTIPNEDIELILSSDQTFNINIKILNKNIK